MSIDKNQKLYSCVVSLNLMVVAETPEQARRIAAYYAEEEAKLFDADDFHASEAVTSRHPLYAEGWTDGDIPYGQDGSALTLGELVDLVKKRLP